MNEKNIMRATPESKALRAKARKAIAPLQRHCYAMLAALGGYDYADGADFDWTVSRLAEIGESMSILLAQHKSIYVAGT